MTIPRTVQKPVDLSLYQDVKDDFAHLSLRDLLTARDLYHAHLARHPNVVATAIGRYRIRKDDSWPNEPQRRHGAGVRTLANSEVRPYSWPCILVFVSQWEEPAAFASRPGDMVPTTLFMPDGGKVPICVIEAPRESRTEMEARNIVFPVNNIGPGRPVVAHVQGQDYVATIACLVSDGHKVYALTNRHVTGDAGEAVYARRGSLDAAIGSSSAKQLTRLAFSALYPSFPGHDTFVNLDLGLIDLDDLSAWTTAVRGVGIVGPMVDFSDTALSLSLVGCHVRGVGAASGDMSGEIHGLFYRYKTSGGFDYVADLMIGPRTSDEARHFITLPGDSGTMWMLEPRKAQPFDTVQAGACLPLAVQWGRNMLHSAGRARPQGFALATLLSRAMSLLDVDLVRDWNLDQPDTWGALGHFSIAARSQVALSGRMPLLDALMAANADIVSRPEADLLKGDFTGMGTQDFVAMADVPDFFWKAGVARQGHARRSEGPNHFADMDQKNPNGKTLLDLTADSTFIDPRKWQVFYDSVSDILTGEAIAPAHRGLLPFRVWQIFDAMVGFVARADARSFVCAAGVLTHYIGDACQPLHISYLHDGDPLRPVTHTFTTGQKAGRSEARPLGQGVHSAYEDDMIFANRQAVLDGLTRTPKVRKTELVKTGFDAARLTIAMMRDTFQLIPPIDIVNAYVAVGHGGRAASAALWQEFGANTIKAMQDGAHLIALLWESAWQAGKGETKIASPVSLSREEAMAIVSPPSFLPSMTIDKIGAVLKRSPRSN